MLFESPFLVATMFCAAPATWNDIFAVTKGFELVVEKEAELLDLFIRSSIPTPEDVDGWIEADVAFGYVKDAPVRAFARRAFRNAVMAVEAAKEKPVSTNLVGAPSTQRPPLSCRPECFQGHLQVKHSISSGYEKTYHLLSAAKAGCLPCVRYWIEEEKVPHASTSENMRSTTLDFAEWKSKVEVVEYLQELESSELGEFTAL